MKGLRWPLGILLAAVVVVILFVVLSGRVVLVTHQVVLPKPVATVYDPETVFYTTRFDGGVRNESPSEAKQGTAEVSLADWARLGRRELFFQLWHADATRVRSLTLRLSGPPGWKQVFEFPGGDGWGTIQHRIDRDGLLITFDHWGWGGKGYPGTIGLSFPLLNDEYFTSTDRFKAQATFDLYKTGFPQLTHWHVTSSWDIPAVRTTEGTK
jgi:hypothetical protein